MIAVLRCQAPVPDLKGCHKLCGDCCSDMAAVRIDGATLLGQDAPALPPFGVQPKWDWDAERLGMGQQLDTT